MSDRQNEKCWLFRRNCNVWESYTLLENTHQVDLCCQCRAKWACWHSKHESRTTSTNFRPESSYYLLEPIPKWHQPAQVVSISGFRLVALQYAKYWALPPLLHRAAPVSIMMPRKSLRKGLGTFSYTEWKTGRHFRRKTYVKHSPPRRSMQDARQFVRPLPFPA